MSRNQSILKPNFTADEQATVPSRAVLLSDTGPVTAYRKKILMLVKLLPYEIS